MLHIGKKPLKALHWSATSARGGSSGGRGRGRRVPHCQLCRKSGHTCPNLSTYAHQVVTPDANLAEAFYAKCHVSPSTPDWYVDSGATTHMTSSSNNVTNATPYSGTANVTVGNGSQNETGSSPRQM